MTEPASPHVALSSSFPSIYSPPHLEFPLSLFEQVDPRLCFELRSAPPLARSEPRHSPRSVPPVPAGSRRPRRRNPSASSSISPGTCCGFSSSGTRTSVPRPLIIFVARGPRVGERCRKQKFSYSFHQDHLGVHLATSHWMHLHTFVDRARKRSKNGDDVVEHDVIQITDDQAPNERHLRVQHTYGTETSPIP